MAAVELGRQLRERGHRITYLANRHSPTGRAVEESKLPLLPFSIHGYIDPLGVKKIREWVKKEDVDLVHTHYSKDLWVLAPALSVGRKKIPLVLTKHIGTMRPKRDLLHRLIYRRVDAVIAVSKLIRQNVIQTHPVPQEKVRTIPNGVDLRRFGLKDVDRKAVRVSLGIPQDAVVVGMAGRLSWWKGYREFLEMAQRLIRARSDVFFLAIGGSTVGEENEADAIRNFARPLSLDGRIVFTGFREDVDRLYGAMDVFVYPAYAEAFGLVLIEAMASGLPVVSSNSDGVPEIVVDGKTGRLVRPRDSDALNAAVMEMLENSNTLKEYGRAGRQRVMELYDIQKIVDQIEILYGELIARRKCRSD